MTQHAHCVSTASSSVSVHSLLSFGWLIVVQLILFQSKNLLFVFRNEVFRACINIIVKFQN